MNADLDVQGPETRWSVNDCRRFDVELLSNGQNQMGSAKELTIEELVSLCEPSPCKTSFNRVGSVKALLSFEYKVAALDAIVWFWRRRLSGEHMLTSVPRFDGVGELDERMKVLFLEYIEKLQETGLMKRLVLKMNELDAVQGRKRPSEVKGIRRRVAEFRRGIWCLRDYIDGKECKEFSVLKLGTEEFGFDWGRIHLLLLREHRRLKDGLPIYGFRQEILQQILTQQVTVLVGETGSGKSTQLVQFLVDSGFAVGGSILCTQPRKIAARSLAERVEDEVHGCYGDTPVVCYPYYSPTQGFGSKIIYTTDHCLLQHLLRNKDLSGVSCIFVDEAHERSLNTDLVLALTKGILGEKNDLRLIVMSATVDSSKLSAYFHGCGRFHMTGRGYPCEIVYVPGECEGLSSPVPVAGSYNIPSYVSDVVRLSKKIHETESDGAILAFLTSQAEVEWACENFQSLLATAIALHGKLSPGEQSRAFQACPGKRKVIFATNLAETSVTIPGVKYVVDSGMVKESRYQPSSGVNLLQVSRISQSSADQRAGRASRTMPGKCFRLYSKSDFQSMPLHQEPEICKVHLGIAILKIVASGISNVEEFDFIDAPNPQSIDMAIKNLTQIGALNCQDGVYELTHDGHFLAKLGVDPRLGKIILEGCHYGLQREAVVLATVMSNASSIFCRVGTDDDKLKADGHKVQFCHQDGDLFTFLSVYQEWEKVSPFDRNKWCWSNSINAKTVRRCQEMVIELENCLKHDLSIDVPNDWQWSRHYVSASNTSLKKILLSALADNIAVYSGYDRLGYEVIANGEFIQLHPSCSLHIYSQKPDWIVFTELLSLSRPYLICVNAVDFEFISMFAPPSFDILMAESQRLHSKVISGFGSTAFRRFCGKSNSRLHSLLSRMQSMFMDKRIGMEVNPVTYEVTLFASLRDIEKVYDMAYEYLSYEMKFLSNECLEKCLYHGGRSGDSPPLALFGAGAEIKHLELENRPLAVNLSLTNGNVPEDKEVLIFFEKSVSGVCAFFKSPSSGRESEDEKKWGKVVFLSPEAASKALEFSGIELSGSSLKLSPAQYFTGNATKSSTFAAVKATVFWPRRYSKGIAFVRCEHGDEEDIINDCQGALVGGRFIECECAKYDRRIVVKGLDVGTSEPEIFEALRGATSKRISDVFLVRGAAVADRAPNECKKALLKEITPFMPNHHPLSDYFQVQVFPPQPKDYYMKASVVFDRKLHLEAARALENLRGRVLAGHFSWQKMQCQQFFSTSLSCPAVAYRSIEKDLISLLESFKHRPGVNWSLQRNENGSYRVTVTTNATNTIAKLRRQLEQLMNGKLLSHDRLSREVLQLLFSSDGKELMRSIQPETRTCILFDRQKLKVRVYGSDNDVGLAEQKLVEGLLSRHDDKPRNIFLRGRGLPPDVMKRVVETFGPDLHKLKEKFSKGEFQLNTRQQVISYTCNAALSLKVEDEILGFVQSLSVAGSPEQHKADDTACPICLCEVEDCYQLEACGHRFCRACLVDQFKSATGGHDFPVCCTQKGCKKQILFADLKSLLSSDEFDDLFRASLGAFVASSGGVYRFCPSPDCPSVYRATKGKTMGEHFTCGACYAEICTSCHLEYHPFVSCERYKEFKDEDTSLKDWCSDKDYVKSCSVCGYVIEKIEGCDHVQCKCGRHICWACLETFGNSSDCYRHISSQHMAI